MTASCDRGSLGQHLPPSFLPSSQRREAIRGSARWISATIYANFNLSISVRERKRETSSVTSGGQGKSQGIRGGHSVKGREAERVITGTVCGGRINLSEGDKKRNGFISDATTPRPSQARTRRQPDPRLPRVTLCMRRRLGRRIAYFAPSAS